MVTYWLEGERKASNNSYRQLSEMDKYSSLNSSMGANDKQSNPPDYIDYNNIGKAQQTVPELDS